MVTEYREKFVAHDVSSAQQAKVMRDEYRAPEGMMANMTTFRSDYTPPGVTQRPPRAAMVYVAPKGSLSFVTTYTHDYKAHARQYSRVTKSAAYRPPALKMETQSSYKDDFQPWDIQKPPSCRSNITHLTLSDAQFDLSTSRGYCCPKSWTLRNRLTLAPQSQDHETVHGLTDYQLHDICHTLQPRQPKQVKDQANHIYSTSTEPFCGVTTHKHDYRGLQGERAKAFTPSPAWGGNSAPFEGNTEFQDSYKAWPVMPTIVHDPTGRCPLKDHKEVLSPAHGKRRGRHSQPSLSVCPVHTWHRDEVQLTAKADCRAWDARGRAQVTERAVACTCSVSHTRRPVSLRGAETIGRVTPCGAHAKSSGAGVLPGPALGSPEAGDRRLDRTVTQRSAAVTPVVVSGKTTHGCWGRLRTANPGSHSGTRRAQ